MRFPSPTPSACWCDRNDPELTESYPLNEFQQARLEHPPIGVMAKRHMHKMPGILLATKPPSRDGCRGACSRHHVQDEGYKQPGMKRGSPSPMMLEGSNSLWHSQIVSKPNSPFASTWTREPSDYRDDVPFSVGISLLEPPPPHPRTPSPLGPLGPPGHGGHGVAALQLGLLQGLRGQEPRPAAREQR